MMGIFQKKSSDFGSLFTRNKKEKMTSKENEEEESLVSLTKTNKQSRKTSRKNKHKTSLKFRRLQDDFAEPGTPEYEPPKGDLFPQADGPKAALFSTKDSEPAVPTNIQVSASTDTMSTLEGSLADIVRKQNHEKRKPDVREKRKPDEEPLVPSKHATSGWVLNFEDRSFRSIPSEQPEAEQPEIDNSKKSRKKDKKIVQPKFYPLEDAPSNEGSSKFENPKFNDPFTTSERPKIQFACSEEYENDENVEKVSESGSDDFHQFVIRKMPSHQPTVSADQSTSKREASLVKAAKTIAISLSSPSPKKKTRRMVPSESAKRTRHVLGETKALRNRTPIDSKQQVKTVASDSIRMSSEQPQVSYSGTNPWSIIASDSSISHPSTGDSLVLGKKDLVKQSIKTNIESGIKTNIERVESEEMGLFDIGTFSQLDDQVWPPVASSKEAQLQTTIDGHQSVDSRGDDLINLIRSSSMRSQNEAAKKPDPSPTQSRVDTIPVETSNFPTSEKIATNNVTLHGAEALTAENTSSLNCSFLELNPSKSSSGPASTSNPSGIPSNAILGSMLFRRAHSESTMVLPDDKGRVSDPFDDETQEVPLQLELDFMEQQALSSVTEDAGSFYHENFEKWNNRANKALNNFYKTASSNMHAYKRNTFQEVQENTLYDA
jgi:hypothetical protein